MKFDSIQDIRKDNINNWLTKLNKNDAAIGAFNFSKSINQSNKWIHQTEDIQFLIHLICDWLDYCWIKLPRQFYIITVQGIANGKIYAMDKVTVNYTNSK